MNRENYIFICSSCHFSLYVFDLVCDLGFVCCTSRVPFEIVCLLMTLLLQSKPLHKTATAKNPLTQCLSAVSPLISVRAALNSPASYSALESVWLAFSAKGRHFLQEWVGIWMVFQRVTWESVPSMQCSHAHILDMLVCCWGFSPNFFFLDPISKTNVLTVTWWIDFLYLSFFLIWVVLLGSISVDLALGDLRAWHCVLEQIWQVLQVAWLLGRWTLTLVWICPHHSKADNFYPIMERT